MPLLLFHYPRRRRPRWLFWLVYAGIWACILVVIAFA
jgi:hypothetical protein